MRYVANAAIIDEKGALLILRKSQTWILPGGKPLPGENDEECLQREFSEELSGSKLSVDEHYKDFKGVSPHFKDDISVRVYLCSLEGILGPPSGEIKEAHWLMYAQRDGFPLSDVTKKIVDSLREDNRYSGF